MSTLKSFDHKMFWVELKEVRMPKNINVSTELLIAKLFSTSELVAKNDSSIITIEQATGLLEKSTFARAQISVFIDQERSNRMNYLLNTQSDAPIIVPEDIASIEFVDEFNPLLKKYPLYFHNVKSNPIEGLTIHTGTILFEYSEEEARSKIVSPLVLDELSHSDGGAKSIVIDNVSEIDCSWDSTSACHYNYQEEANSIYQPESIEHYTKNDKRINATGVSVTDSEVRLQ